MRKLRALNDDKTIQMNKICLELSICLTFFTPIYNTTSRTQLRKVNLNDELMSHLTAFPKRASSNNQEQLINPPNAPNKRHKLTQLYTKSGGKIISANLQSTRRRSLSLEPPIIQTNSRQRLCAVTPFHTNPRTRQQSDFRAGARALAIAIGSKKRLIRPAESVYYASRRLVDVGSRIKAR